MIKILNSDTGKFIKFPELMIKFGLTCFLIMVF